MSSIGTLAIQLIANTGVFAQQMRGAAGMVARFSAKVLATGAALRSMGGMLSGVVLGGGIVYAIKKSADAMSELVDTADNLGIGTEKLVALRKAGEEMGASAGGMDVALARFNRTLGEAGQGNKAAIESFRRLGLNATDLAKIPLQEAFYRVADSITAMGSSGERTAAVMDIFGRGSKNIMTLLSGGSKAIREYEQITRDLGTAFTRLDAARVDAVAEAMGRVKDSITAVVSKLMIDWAPAVTQVAKSYTDMVASSTSANDGMVESMQTAATHAQTVQDALYGIEKAAYLVAIGWGAIADVFLNVFGAGEGAVKHFGSVAIDVLNAVGKGFHSLDSRWSFFKKQPEGSPFDPIKKPDWMDAGGQTGNQSPDWYVLFQRQNEEFQQKYADLVAEGVPSGRATNASTEALKQLRAAKKAAEQKELDKKYPKSEALAFVDKWIAKAVSKVKVRTASPIKPPKPPVVWSMEIEALEKELAKKYPDSATSPKYKWGGGRKNIVPPAETPVVWNMEIEAKRLTVEAQRRADIEKQTADRLKEQADIMRDMTDQRSAVYNPSMAIINPNVLTAGTGFKNAGLRKDEVTESNSAEILETLRAMSRGGFGLT